MNPKTCFLANVKIYGLRIAGFQGWKDPGAAKPTSPRTFSTEGAKAGAKAVESLCTQEAEPSKQPVTAGGRPAISLLPNGKPKDAEDMAGWQRSAAWRRQAALTTRSRWSRPGFHPLAAGCRLLAGFGQAPASRRRSFAQRRSVVIGPASNISTGATCSSA